jgi:hypothetical protein
VKSTWKIDARENGELPLWARGVVVLAAVFVCWRFAYCLIFSGFIDYDDEGVFLMILHQMDRGRVLYNQMITIYGPVAFYPKLAILKLLDLPITHDVGRMMTLCGWVGTSVLTGAAAWKLGRSVAWFGVATIAVCIALLRIIHEPGHPQDLCCLFVAGGALASLFWEGKRKIWVAASLGVLGAALLFTKINLGIFFAAALGATLLMRLVNKRLAIGTYLAAAIPFLLMSHGFNEHDVLCYALTCSLGIVGCVVAGFRSTGDVKRRDIGVCAAVFLGTSALVVVLTMAMGSSLSGLLNGMIAFPLRLTKNYAIGSPMDDCAVAAAAVGIGLARIVSKAPRKLEYAWPVAKCALGIAAIFCALFHQEEYLLRFGPGSAWMVALPASGNNGKTFGRVFLAFLAVMESMWAYPICGAQLSFSVFLFVLIGVVALADGLGVLVTAAGRGWMWPRIAAIGLFLIVLGIGSKAAMDTGRLYASLVPFGLPGADRIRVDPAKAAAYGTIVQELKDNADIFGGQPVMNSLYLWTKMEPPAGSIHTLWNELLTDAQQQAIIDELQKHPRACLVESDKLMAFWLQGRPIQSGILADYYRQNYVPLLQLAQVQGYSINLFARKDRQEPVYEITTK